MDLKHTWGGDRFRKIALVAIPVILLSSCESETKTFGRSYDECVLRNATKGGDETSRFLATDICRRRFERTPTAEERKKFLSEVVIKFNEAGILDSNRSEDRMSATVWNEDENLVITQVVVNVDFYKTPPNAAGGWPKDTWSEPAVWSRDVAIQPDTDDTIIGTFGDDERAPTKFYVGTVDVRKVLPLGRK